MLITGKDELNRQSSRYKGPEMRALCCVQEEQWGQCGFGGQNMGEEGWKAAEGLINY